MVAHTIAEIFGHILFSFTSSVADHYNLRENDIWSALYSYSALDDTGREWYVQPVDEVIFQEYNNTEAVSRDYLASGALEVTLIDASSTDDSGPSCNVSEERDMAWKQLRPSFLHTICNSMYFGLFISVLTAFVVGLVSIVAFYFSFQTQLICLTRPKESIPLKLQWVIATSKIFSNWFTYLAFFLNVLCYFQPFQISGLRSKLFFLCLTFYVFDSAYRIALQVLGIEHSNWGIAHFIYYTNICIQVCMLARHFYPRPKKKQIKIILVLMAVCVMTQLSGELFPHVIYPVYNKQQISGKITIAIFAPLITVLLKGITRICVQRLWCRISHPATSFVLLAPLYCGSALMIRLLQVDLQSLESVALIGVIHGIAQVTERSTMVFIDHFYHQVLEKRKLPWGGFRTPRRERLAADICIMSMLYESSAIISLNGFLYLYQYFYIANNTPLQLLQSFALTTSVPLVIEWFFTSVSIAIETRYKNMPITVVWRRRWKRHITVAFINMVMISIWASTCLLIAIQARSPNKTKDYCEMPFSSGQ